MIEYDYGQPIDYPDTIDLGMQDQLGGQVIEHDYGQPIDYDHANEGYDWEEDGPYDSY